MAARVVPAPRGNRLGQEKSRRSDSNRRPAVYETAALPAELRRHWQRNRVDPGSEIIAGSLRPGKPLKCSPPRSGKRVPAPQRGHPRRGPGPGSTALNPQREPASARTHGGGNPLMGHLLTALELRRPQFFQAVTMAPLAAVRPKYASQVLRGQSGQLKGGRSGDGGCSRRGWSGANGALPP